MRRQAIERLLPAAYQRAVVAPGPLPALLEVMELLHEPDERTLEAVEDLFTPYRSPDRMVSFLLGWVALDHVLPPRAPGSDGPDPSGVPMGRQRDLVATGAELAQRRGTADGLRRVIATATGVRVRVEEPADRAFHIVVRVPSAAAALIPFISRLIEAEKPAATTFEVVAGDSANQEPAR